MANTRSLLATTLVAGGSMAERETVLAQITMPTAAVIIEGLPTGQAVFPDAQQLIRLAPACLCCAGNLVLTVHLNRLLRQTPPPSALFIVLHNAEHLPQLRAQLVNSPYDAYLLLSADYLIA